MNKKLLLCLIFFPLCIFAQTPPVSVPTPTPNNPSEPVLNLNEDLKSLDYPELQVVPRASERLMIESAAVRDKGMMALFPYVLSSTFTLASGVVVNSGLRSDISPDDQDRARSSAKIAMGLGALGLGLAYWHTNSDNYGAVAAQIRGLKNKDRRTELLKERLAEEAFERSAEQFSRWKWVFATTNLIACAELTGKTKGDSNAIPTVGIAAALLPLFIKSSFETNYQKQIEYKRRIYVPLSWFDYRYDTQAKNFEPQMNLAWMF